MHDLDRDPFEVETIGTDLAGEPALGQRSAEEIALASELLDIRSAGELEQFLSGLLRRIGGANRAFARSGTGRKLAGILAQVGSQAVPMLGGLPGTDSDDPAPNPLGLELEGLSAEDRE